MDAASLYPCPTKEHLARQFVGRSIDDVPTPAAILDLSKLKNNCSRMLEACDALGWGWRAHIKTHKTIELTRLQVGTGTRPVNIIVSTVSEAEFVLPLLLEYQSQGRAVNLLYAFPITPSVVTRLSHISKALGHHGLSLMVDHRDQLSYVGAVSRQSGVMPSVFLKIDMGGKRAGIPVTCGYIKPLITSLLARSAGPYADLHFLGLYSHAGQSYHSNSSLAALDLLMQEFDTLMVAAEKVREIALYNKITPPSLVLSVGATPTATSIRNILVKNADTSAAEAALIDSLQGKLSTYLDKEDKIEIHAGVYPMLDLQQLATHALPMEGPNAMLTWDNMALTILAEVASVYPGRGASWYSEALVAAGTFALGREPCKAYGGFGVLTPWNRPDGEMPDVSVEKYRGWTVGRISQEHGILTYNGTKEADVLKDLRVGQKVRIWPNHACIASGGYGYYLVVDGENVGNEDEIVDVWVRCRGW